MRDVPKRLVQSKYRKDLWKQVKSVVSQIEGVLPIKEAYLMGSFTTKKRRPADIDFMVLLKTKNHTKANWSFDLVMAPDNAHGKFVLEDVKKWMKQKYGARKSQVFRLK